jgi:hypothetical protein
MRREEQGTRDRKTNGKRREKIQCSNNNINSSTKQEGGHIIIKV